MCYPEVGEIPHPLFLTPVPELLLPPSCTLPIIGFQQFVPLLGYLTGACRDPEGIDHFHRTHYLGPITVEPKVEKVFVGSDDEGSGEVSGDPGGIPAFSSFPSSHPRKW